LFHQHRISTQPKQNMNFESSMKTPASFSFFDKNHGQRPSGMLRNCF
jgi:hypothetical protein